MGNASTDLHAFSARMSYGMQTSVQWKHWFERDQINNCDSFISKQESLANAKEVHDSSACMKAPIK